MFVAAGTGIAPFRGMAMELLQRNPVASQIHLVMGAPYTTDLIYDDLFTEMAAEHANFHYYRAISRETRPDGRRGQYVHHLMDERMDLFGPVLANPRTLLYICGLGRHAERPVQGHGAARRGRRVFHPEEVAGRRGTPRIGS